ncbi:HNH endonuclease [Aspergillus homomorphus CBS 101889]|uniref:HNH domain-containing protein n=1 Tax=Aspergillus homomorphus (strain CBS 101889) TaxID=1450537 RepID=A0A395HNN4_ASPHC|nr:hypothetical protein BO97DRAFT_396264 [Aspergillus homomorphus CBS 101889]RAL09541.1 hypothetical protein BO97DRAFT_396264 [Aspergillus homomorphus CBS 101889]
MSALHAANYQVFRDCLSTALVEKFSTPAQPKKARRNRGAVSQRQKPRSKDSVSSDRDTTAQSLPDRASPEELAEFVDVRCLPPSFLHPRYSLLLQIHLFLASETFPALPPDLQTLTYTPPPTTSSNTNPPPSTSTSTSTPNPDTENTQTTPEDARTLAETLCTTTLPPSVPDTLTAYALLDTPTTTSPNAHEANDNLTTFFTPILAEYIAATTKPPPVWATTRKEACEICARDWIPLSYHHLIPRSVHAKALKKGWHPEWMLNSVAWLCRACHSFVHRMASNEELAREWFTVERILEREDVLSWASWVGRVRWKSK